MPVVSPVVVMLPVQQLTFSGLSKSSHQLEQVTTRFTQTADVFQPLTPRSVRFSSALPDKSLLMAEIKEQPQALQQLIDHFPAQFSQLNLPKTPPKNLVMIGEGSSKNALDIASDYVSMFTGLPVKTVLPATFEQYFPLQTQYQDITKSPVMTEGLFVALSQSGKSASTLRAVEPLAKYYQVTQNAMPFVSMTNNPSAQLASLYGNHMYLHAGDENSIAATKSMTNSIMSALLFGLFYGQQNGRTANQKALDELTQLPQKLDGFLKDDGTHQALKQFTQQLAGHNQFVLLSNGPFAHILPEAGLKMTETSSNVVLGYNTESFKHGPKVILDKQPAVLYMIPPGLNAKESETFFADVQEHFKGNPNQPFNKSKTYFVRYENSPELPATIRKEFALNDEKIVTLPASKSFTGAIESQFLGIVTAQLLSYYLAEAKGVNPNHPALSKAVTK